MDKHGPMEISDERLFGQLAILPENSQMLIQNFGGLEKFLLSSTAFVKHEGLLCLAEYAAVVAASMNSNNMDDDMPTPSLDSNSFRHNKEIQELKAYELKQKRYSKVSKDPLLGVRKSASIINGVAHNAPLFSSNNGNKNEVGIKKNSAMPQQASKQGHHTSTPPPGFASSSPLGKSPYSNKSMYTRSNNSNTSNYSNGSHLLEAAGRKTSSDTRYHNTKESLSSSVNSGLDPIDNSLTFTSTKRQSGLSTSTEHSQEGPNGEDDELIGNLFDYNAFGTGSSGNYSSPSNEGYFPNAYPQEQIDSNSLLSEISLPAVDANVTSKPSFSKKSSSSKLESAITASNIMDSTDDMKLLASKKTSVPASYSINSSSCSKSIPYSDSGHHMEPVYLPPPPPITQKPISVEKKDACVETDIVYVYCENYKEKYEAAMRSQSEVVKRLQESEDRRVQMSKTHAVDMDLAVRRATDNANMVMLICNYNMC